MVGQRSTPLGIVASQTWEQVCNYLQAIEEYHIKLFVELGIHKGGLAAVMLARTEYVSDFHYLGVEIDRERVDWRVRDNILGNPRADAIYGDCLSDSVKFTVSNTIQQAGGKVFLLCDNGNKSCEIDAYAPLIRPGDYLAAHDYPAEIGDDDLLFLDDSPYYEAVNPQRWRYILHVPLYRRVM